MVVRSGEANRFSYQQRPSPTRERAVQNTSIFFVSVDRTDSRARGTEDVGQGPADRVKCFSAKPPRYTMHYVLRNALNRRIGW